MWYVPTRKTRTRHPTIVKIVKQIPRTMRYSILNSFGSTVSFKVDFHRFGYRTLKPYWNAAVNLPMAPLSDLSSKWPINLPIPWDSESMINNLQPIYYLYKSEGEYSELWMPWLYSNIYYLSQNSELPFFSWAWVASMNNRNIFLEKSYSIIQVV